MSVIVALLFSAYLVRSKGDVEHGPAGWRCSAGTCHPPTPVPAACRPCNCCQVYDIQMVMGGKAYAISPDEYVFASVQVRERSDGSRARPASPRGPTPHPPPTHHSCAPVCLLQIYMDVIIIFLQASHE